MQSTLIDFPFALSTAGWAITGANDRGTAKLGGQAGIGRMGIVLGTESEADLGGHGEQRYGGGFETGLRYEAVKTDQWLFTPAIFYTWKMSGQNQHDQPFAITYRATSHVVQPSLLSAYVISSRLGITPEVALRFENLSASPGADLVATASTSALTGATVDLNLSRDTTWPLQLQGSLLESFALRGGNSVFQGSVGFFARIKKDGDLGIEVIQRVGTSLTDTAAAISANAYF